ncbi:fimbria/pilus outer membrane usher protein, partial [Citrobacter amalonaticus]
IGPDPRNFNQRVSLGRNDLLIRTFPDRCCTAVCSKIRISPNGANINTNELQLISI